VLLHGLGATSQSWDLQIPALTQAGFRVIAPDARGFGCSPYPGGNHRIADMADDVAALLQRIDGAPAHVIGISMGGTLALQLALDHAELVRRLVLVNTFASLRPDRPSVWLYFALRMLLVNTVGLQAQAQTVARRIFPRPEQSFLRETLIAQICQADPRGYRVTMRALALFDVTRRLGEIRAPTLIVSGADDTTVPLKSQRLLVERISGARHLVIAAAGHAVTVEQPHAFNQAIVEFLTS